MNIERARKLMAEQGVDALVVVGPENVSYATGAPVGFVHMWRSFGPYIGVVPADRRTPTAAIVADHHERSVREAGLIAEVRTHSAWVEYTDVTNQPEGDIRERVRAASGTAERTRPERYDLSLITRMLRELVGDLGLSTARLGVEFDALPYADKETLWQALDGATIVDSSQLLRETRVIKTERELARLRDAVRVTEAGIRAAVNRVAPGEPVSSVALNYRRGVSEAAVELGIAGLQSSWDIITVGERPWSAPTRSEITRGDLIKFDVGAKVSDYTSDVGRTFTVGPASDAQRTVYEALHQGMTAALGQMTVGNPCSAVFNAAQQAVRDAGFPTYTRGHVGHSIGSDHAHEEWPWLSPSEQRELEPNMVFAVETPFYIDGIGGFMIEHNVVVGTGHSDRNQIMDTLPDGLEEVAV